MVEQSALILGRQAIVGGNLRCLRNRVLVPRDLDVLTDQIRPLERHEVHVNAKQAALDEQEYRLFGAVVSIDTVGVTDLLATAPPRGAAGQLPIEKDADGRPCTFAGTTALGWVSRGRLADCDISASQSDLWCPPCAPFAPLGLNFTISGGGFGAAGAGV